MHDNYGNIMIVKNKKMYVPKNYNKDNSLFVYSLGAGEVCLIKEIMLILKITHIKTLQTKYYLISIETI